MDNKDKNIIDKFLDGYEKSSNTQRVYTRVYERPSKLKSLVGFIFSLLCFIILIRLFVFKMLYFVILIFNLLILAFYSINLFTEKGIGLPKTVEMIEDIEDADTDDDNDIYKVQ